MNRPLLPPRTAGRLGLGLLLAAATCVAASAQHDLSLYEVTSDPIADLGDVVSVTYVLTNDLGTDVAGVSVDIDLPPGLDFVSASGDGTYADATGTWTVPDFAFFDPQRTLVLQLLVVGDGVQTVVAEVASMQGADGDSAPGNADPTEDDRVGSCVSVPIEAQCGQAVRLDAPAGLGSYQWYRDGAALPGATAATLDVAMSGSYSYRAGDLAAACPLRGCCAAIVSFDVIELALSQNELCSGNLDTVFVTGPEMEVGSLTQTFSWSSIDDPLLNFLSCDDCLEPAIVIDRPYANATLSYAMTVVTTDAAGDVQCSATTTIAVDVWQAPVIAFATPAYVCADQPTTLAVSTDLPITSVAWDGPNLRTPDGLTMTYWPRPVASVTPETFVVEVVGIDGCIRRDSVTVTTLPALTPSIIADAQTCQNTSVDLTVSAPSVAADSIVVAWSEDPGNPNAGANLPTTNLASVTTGALSPGTYRFRVSVSRLAPNGTVACTYELSHEVLVDPDCQQPQIGGYAWKDADNDGERQPFEAPMAGVSVELFEDGGAPTGLTATTDAAGFYEFSGLAVGRYYVQFQALPGFVFAPQNAVPDEFRDSDVDAAGRSDVYEVGYDQTLHLVGAGYVADCALAIVNVQATPAECGVSEGTLSFDVYGSSGNLTYTWVPAVSTTTSAADLPAGDYEVTVYDEFTECSLTDTLTVPGTRSFVLTSSSTPSACPLGRGGFITLTTDGGTAPFTVEYAGTDSGTLIAASMPYAITDLRGGTYDLVVTDASGCRQVDQVFVDENTLLLAIDTANVVAAGCAGAPTGSYDVLLAGFSGSYTLTLNGLTIAANGTSPTVPVTNQSGGAQVLEATDENGCTQRFDFVLEDAGDPIDPADLLLTDAACYGEATGAIASASGRALSLIDAAGRRLGTLPQSGLVAGTYTLLDDSVPNCIETYEVELTQSPRLELAAVVIGSDCDVASGSITLELEGGTAPYSIDWAGDVGAGVAAIGLAPGTYALRVLDAAGCAIDTALQVPNICEPLVCAPYFTTDTLILTTDEAGTWCVNNFELPTTYDFTLDGLPVTQTPCTRSTLTTYKVNALPGNGGDGPYILEFWFAEGAMGVGEVVADAAELAAALDRVDAWGRWRYDEATQTIRGGTPGGAYGEVEITHVASGVNFYLTPEPLLNQQSFALSLAAGSYDLRAVSDLDGCRDSIHVIVRDPDVCAGAFAVRSTSTTTPYCDQDAPVCIPLPFRLSAERALRFDGAAYAGTLEPCDLAETIYYDLDGLAITGTIFLDAWTVDGRFESARVTSIEELAARLAAFDGQAWRYDEHTRYLRNGDPDRAYGDLVLRWDGGAATLQPQRDLYDGTRVYLSAGVHRGELIGDDGCVTRFSVTLGCSSATPQTDTVRWHLGVGFTDTLCVDASEVPGAIERVENLCADASGEYAVVVLGDTTCLIGEGIEVGVDTVCLVACDADGVCDTTIVLVEVLDPLDFLLPVANPDHDSLQMGGLTFVDVLANDEVRGELTSLEIVIYPANGTAFVVDSTIRYIPDPTFCGVDSLVYELCNPQGCDTAVVRLTTLCDELIIFSGFSPNRDDVNETFMILGVEQFPANELEIFNRWGNLVYEADGYDNTWDGTDLTGDELPEGTYFYIFLDGQGRTYTGYVYLKR